MKITIEEKDLLEDLASDTAIVSALLKEMDLAVRAAEDAVLKWSLDSSTNTQSERQLVVLKARAEGAAQLARAFKQRLERYRKQPKTR